MSHLHAPLTLPKHPDLLFRINEMIIDIRLHQEKSTPAPSWDELVALLKEAYSAINEQREDPRKY